MDDAAHDSPALPVWARPSAFPEAPGGWGWIDPKGASHPCASPEALTEVVATDDTGIVDLVWTPEHPRMRLPGEVPALHHAILTSRSKWVRADLDDYTSRLWRGLSIFAAVFGWIFFGKFKSLAAVSSVGFTERLLLSIKQTLNHNVVEIGFLLLVMFVIIPWYQAKKRHSELGDLATPEGLAETLPAMRFETWLARQSAPFTKYFFGLIAIVGIAQLVLPSDGENAAGLLKDRLLEGETWRLFTAPFLHGNPIHFAMNAAALLYLGKRLEVFARWPHLAMVFLFAAIIGGQTSASFMPTPSVGASGGLMGWLGFLIVFETLHAKLVPRSSRRRLAAAVFLTALIGVLGHRFIDNYAHAGGLVAGMLYALIVFPKSDSAYRPTSTLTDRIMGSIALAACTASALFAVWKITLG